MNENDVVLTPVELEIRRTNNFICNLPDPACPEIPGEPKIKPGYYRNQYLELGWINRVIGEGQVSRGGPHSELYLGQTHRQFFHIIDQLVEAFSLFEELMDIYRHRDEQAIVQAELRNKNYKINLGDPRIPWEVREKALVERLSFSAWQRDVRILTLPIFWRMRGMGYTNHDLSA